MSQRIVFEIIQSFNDGVSREQIVDKIEKKHPDRSLSKYLNLRLQALLKKGAVSSREVNGEKIYYTPENSKFSPESLGVDMGNLDAEVSKEELNEYGIEIVNIVGSGTIGENINLQRLATEISNVEYEPETSPMAVWRPLEESSETVLIPTSGRVTVVGSASRESLLLTTDKIEATIPEFCYEEVNEAFESDIKINNIVGSADLGREFDLAEVAVGLGLEKVEYDPEQFPGLVYNLGDGSVILIFRTGKVVITSTNTYEKVLRAYERLCQDLKDIGVKFNNK
jgi:transcription initiation factor TFIID TATA-box-binding protein